MKNIEENGQKNILHDEESENLAFITKEELNFYKLFLSIINKEL